MHHNSFDGLVRTPSLPAQGDRYWGCRPLNFKRRFVMGRRTEADAGIIGDAKGL